MIRDGVAPGQQALADAVDWYHEQIDDPIPDAGEYETAREYYREGRGWTNETIVKKRLGYAPADTGDQLLAHLHRQGHDREGILGSGLFRETDDGSIYAIWTGRYVLPYLNDDGRGVFAISRALEPAHPADWAGRYGDDDEPSKYHKLPVSREHVDIEEPIYGLDTIRAGEPLLVTEGIADAITAHQAGHPCVSPVTTTFKKRDRERLVSACERRDVSRVYLAQDAEPPTSALTDGQDGWDTLNIEQFGEGLRGATETAGFLAENGVDARIAELPQPAAQKVDLDDYLARWDGDLRPVLAAAVPVDEHPAHDPKRAAVDAAKSTQFDTDTTSSDGQQSALFELDIRDVTGLQRGYRGTNTLGHHGNSENYFVVYDDSVAYDHKHKTAYNAMTYLLVEAGERPARNPNGQLDDGEVFAAWRHAKQEGYIDSGDPIPRRALRHVARTATGWDGETVEHSTSDGETFQGLPRATYNAALDAAEREHGVAPGRDHLGTSSDGEQHETDPRTVEATVDVRRAWDAAERVEPADLPDGHGLPTTDDGEQFVVGVDAVDVVRAVAVADGLIDTPDAPMRDVYPDAYERARDEYGAPLPAYYTTGDMIFEFDAVVALLGELDFFDLDSSAFDSTVTATGDDVSGDAVRALDPAWRESESGESVLVFNTGTVWDADTETTIDALRFVALDSGLVSDPTAPVAGETFTDAYERARDEYGAPLPEWHLADASDPDVTPQLPPADELLDSRDVNGVDTDTLDDARERVEDLVRAAATDSDQPHVVTAPPATGKTTGVFKLARERPVSYLSPRLELQDAARRRAERWGVSYEVLPVFADETVVPKVLDAAVTHVRQSDDGKRVLKQRWAILDAVARALGMDTDELEVFSDGYDADSPDLERASCETADGKHGDAWALAVHTARALGYTPREIHQQAAGLFGAPLPCCDGEGDCEYTEGWDKVNNADDPADLFIGSYGHAHVEGVRTHRSRGPDGSVTYDTRAVVIDEFPGEAFARSFGENADDHATWLASCLDASVDDRRDLYDTDLCGNDWMDAWLDGNGTDHDAVADLSEALARTRKLYDAQTSANEILEKYGSDGVLADFDALAGLEAAVSGDWCAAYDALIGIENVNPERPGASVARWIAEAVVEPLARGTQHGAGAPDLDTDDVGDTPLAGDLAALVSRAIETADTGTDGAHAALNAALSALDGGTEGCRRLAAWADDGYAHPDAHHLLRGVITPTGDGDPGDRVETSEYAFDPDADDGTVLDVVDAGERGTVMVDRNGHGARLHTPPSRQAASGEDSPLVGLDATGRAALWRVVLGESVELADIHDTDAERAEFFEQALDLRVIQASDIPRYYEGATASKNLDGDVALLRALADEYAGIEAPRQRGDAPVEVGNPAAITTQSVRQQLAGDDRLDGTVADWEHYGNLNGTNDLGDHQLAAVLGCQHYGDASIERFCALDGVEVDTSRESGRGSTLDYGADLANEYLGHMTEDQVTQAVLRFTRGRSGATVVCRTSAVADELPTVGRAQVARTWSQTATEIARAWRAVGDEFTAADVADAVDVSRRQINRILGEFVAAGYIERVEQSPGTATVYAARGQPGAGEAELPARSDAVDASSDATPRQSPQNKSYTWNVGVRDGPPGGDGREPVQQRRSQGAPPAPGALSRVEPPG
jgi:hypothetical protein